MSSEDAVTAPSPFSALPLELKELIFFHALPHHPLFNTRDLKAATTLARTRARNLKTYLNAQKRLLITSSNDEWIIEDMGRPPPSPENLEYWDNVDKLRRLPEFDVTRTLATLFRGGRAVLCAPLKWQCEMLEQQRRAVESKYIVESRESWQAVVWAMRDDGVYVVWDWLNRRIRFIGGYSTGLCRCRVCI